MAETSDLRHPPNPTASLMEPPWSLWNWEHPVYRQRRGDAVWTMDSASTAGWQDISEQDAHAAKYPSCPICHTVTNNYTSLLNCNFLTDLYLFLFF